MTKYIIVDDHQTIPADTLRQARSIAYRRALDLRPDWCKARPVWCGPEAWNATGSPRTVGGYDACGSQSMEASQTIGVVVYLRQVYDEKGE